MSSGCCASDSEYEFADLHPPSHPDLPVAQKPAARALRELSKVARSPRENLPSNTECERMGSPRRDTDESRRLGVSGGALEIDLWVVSLLHTCTRVRSDRHLGSQVGC